MSKYYSLSDFYRQILKIVFTKFKENRYAVNGRKIDSINFITNRVRATTSQYTKYSKNLGTNICERISDIQTDRWIFGKSIERKILNGWV